jgi:hypothetical protein
MFPAYLQLLGGPSIHVVKKGRNKGHKKNKGHMRLAALPTRGIYQSGIGLMIPRRSTHQGHISSRNSSWLMMVDSHLIQDQ